MFWTIDARRTLAETFRAHPRRPIRPGSVKDGERRAGQGWQCRLALRTLGFRWAAMAIAGLATKGPPLTGGNWRTKTAPLLAFACMGN